MLRTKNLWFLCRTNLIKTRCSQLKKRKIKTEIQNIIHLFDKVFDKLGEKPLIENFEFKPEKDLNSDFFLRYYSIDKPSRIHLMFEISIGGLSFWIDRAAEIPVWSIDYINQNPDNVELEIKRLFSNPIQVDRQGNKITIKILEQDGQEIRKYKFYNGFGFPWFHKKESVTFKPYFEI